MYSHKEITEIILKIEAEFEVNSIKFQGVLIWPLIRNHIASKLLQGSGNVDLSPLPPLNKTKRCVLSVFFFLYRIRAYRHFCKLKRFRGAAIYISRDDEHKRDFYGSRNYLAEGWLSLNEKVIDSKILRLSDPYIESLFAEYKKFYPALRGYVNIENLDSFFTYLDSVKKIPFDARSLYRELGNIFALSLLFRDLFKYMRTPAVFYSVFFHTNSYAAALATMPLKTISVEVQHGQQGKYSPLNTNFSSIPNEGYHLLPKVFWTWGEVSYERKKEFNASQYHKVIIGGHPRLSTFLKLEKVEAKWKNEKRTVMLALQDVPEPIPPFFIKTLSELTETHEFWIRLHPNMLNKLEDFEEKFKSYPNVKVKWPSTEDLYLLLLKSNFVLTLWSTVVYEGLALGCKGILLSTNGVELMEESVSKNEILYAGDSRRLCELLQKEGRPERASFICSDLGLITNEIKKVYS